MLDLAKLIEWVELLALKIKLKQLAISVLSGLRKVKMP